MPRLLLVDDNPSIHRSAEIQLGATDIELVCLSSGEEAAARLDGGEHFDGAMVDIIMPGMDGWALLDRIRKNPGTARIPVALLAGILEDVDQNRLMTAPIQGFLKKPTELGNLGDRVRQLLAKEVPDFHESAQATVPGVPLKELMKPLPETRVEEPPMPQEDDLLLLTAEDLHPDAPPVPEAAPAPAAMDFQELDMEALSTAEPARGAEPTPAFLPPPELPPTWEEVPAHPEPSPVRAEDLPDLGADLDFPPLPPAVEPLAPAPYAEEEEEEPVVSLAETAPESPWEAPPAEAPVPLAAASPESGLLVQAILADPALLEALAKAVVERLGDRALREIAWELMPELAERMRK